MQETQERTAETAPTKPQLLNRKAKRHHGFRTKRDRSALRSIHEVLAIGPRAWTRRRTGRTPHFQAWMAEAVVQKHLQTMRTRWLADRLTTTEPKVAEVLRLLNTAGYGNVLKVARANRADLLAVKGVGRVGLGRLHSYLRSHSVPLTWEI